MSEAYGKYINLTDDEMVKLAQLGDLEAEELLIRKYKEAVKNRANIYFIVGSDKEDIVQEGMIGIFKAIRDYDKDKDASFKTFAEICITRQIITAIKRATRKKHTPLNTYLPISGGTSDDNTGTINIENILIGNDSNPESKYLLKEEIDYIWANFNNIFSDFEWKVWSEYLKGKTFQEIAKTYDKNVKAVDNAIHRVKKKMENFIK